MKSTQIVSLACAVLLLAAGAAYSADEGKNDAKRDTTTHRDFDTFDTHKHGYITSREVRKNDYVRKHFSKCNVKHDGHMSREEYDHCHE